MLALNVPIVLRVVQQNGDDELVTHLFDAASQHGALVQLSADFVCVLLFAFVTKNRTARHHLQAGQLRQSVYQTLGNPVRKIFGVRILHTVFKGQNGNRINWRSDGGIDWLVSIKPARPPNEGNNDNSQRKHYKEREMSALFDSAENVR